MASRAAGRGYKAKRQNTTVRSGDRL